jgi:YHS domain-containing protein
MKPVSFRTLIAVVFGTLLFFATSFTWAQGPTLRVVLNGFDPVAYFTDSKPVKGDPKFSYDWDEGRYYFASAQHRDMFARDPDRYAPQFGGYCTGSMSRGKRNEGHPEAWIISNGKLYVFGAKNLEAALETRKVAQTDPDFLRTRIPKAEQNWRNKE